MLRNSLTYTLSLFQSYEGKLQYNLGIQDIEAIQEHIQDKELQSGTYPEHGAAI